MMTRKHFEEIAEILGTNEVEDKLVCEMGEFCKRQNSRFDRLRFFEAVRKHQGEQK